MKSIKLTPLTILASVAVLAISFSAGVAIGSRGLLQCRAENNILFEDLKRAVGRGIVVETRLKLCRDEQQGAKK